MPPLYVANRAESEAYRWQGNEMYKQQWIDLKSYYDRPFKTKGLSEEVIVSLKDIFATLSSVIELIINSEFSECFFPGVTMDTIVHVYAHEEELGHINYPSLHFTVFTENRFDIKYLSPKDRSPETKKLAGQVAIETIFLLLQKMKEEMHCQQRVPR